MSNVTSTTASTAAAQQPLTLDAMRRAVAELQKLRVDNKTWRLFAPNGDVYASEHPVDLIRVLAANSDLLKGFSG